MVTRTQINQTIGELESQMREIHADLSKPMSEVTRNVLENHMEDAENQIRNLQETLKTFKGRCTICRKEHDLEFKVLAYMCEECDTKLDPRK